MNKILYILIMLVFPQISSAITVADALPSTRKQLQSKSQYIKQVWNPDAFAKCTSVGIKVQASQIKGVKFKDDTVVVAALLISAGDIYSEELRKSGINVNSSLDGALKSYTQIFLNISQDQFQQHMNSCVGLLGQIAK
jgi:hypothetical protein